MKRVHSSAIVLGVLLACCCLSWAETAKELQAKGEEAYKAKQYQKAVEFYTEALKIEPERHETVYSRGVNYYKLGKRDQALADFNALTSVKDIDHHAWNYIGLIHSREGELAEGMLKPSEAIKNFNEAMAALKKP
jgi:tetratricopeptide (TPR) repeat protein